MKTQRGIVLLAAMLACLAPAYGLDLGVEALFGNLNLPWGSDDPIAGAAYPADLWVYGARVSLTHTIMDGVTLETAYVTDPVLRHLLKSVIAYQAGIVKLSAGPVLGLFNSPQTPLKAGMSVGLRLDLPGIMFVEARADSSLGAGLVSEGDYAQEYAEVSGGWYVPNALCSLGLTTRKLHMVSPGGDLLSDTSNRYAFKVEVYQKGSPWRVLLSMGYQDFSRLYAGGQRDSLGSVFLGARVTADLSESLTINAELESAVYAFGMDDLTGRPPAAGSFLFRSGLGLTYRFGRTSVTGAIPEVQPLQASAESDLLEAAAGESSGEVPEAAGE